MDLVTNGAIVSDALKYVNGKADKLSAASSEVIDSDSDSYKEEKTTTNGMF
jgi:hypothetical protein